MKYFKLRDIGGGGSFLFKFAFQRDCCGCRVRKSQGAGMQSRFRDLSNVVVIVIKVRVGLE